MKLLYLLVLLVVIVAACSNQPAAPRPSCLVRADTVGYIEAVGPAPRGGWIRIPVVKYDSTGCY
jgi:hypothetical protein